MLLVALVCLSICKHYSKIDCDEILSRNPRYKEHVIKFWCHLGFLR